LIIGIFIKQLRFSNFQHHGASRFASTSVVKQSSGGLFSWLLGGSSSKLPPLDVPLPGITVLPPLPDFVERSKTKITTLPNGIKIASETSPVLLDAH
jgi:processing peptidase subunit alpha